MSARIATIIAAAALTALPSLAVAQIDPDGGEIVIEAAEGNIDNAQGIVIYVGDVNAVQGDTQIRSDRLELYFDKSAAGGGGVGGELGELARAVAIGNVYYVTPEQVATGGHALYDVAADTVTMTGDAVVTQGCDVLSGAEIVMNMTTRNTQVRATPDGRVRTVIHSGDDAAPAECPQ